jgi:hypothetical protein
MVQQKLAVMECWIAWRASADGVATRASDRRDAFRAHLLGLHPWLAPTLQDPHSALSHLVDVLARPADRILT